ncbi:uncharacterized protein J3R85_004525 [Psidium guajava]|nr:uncharacterized protein J3R85_004525 [Psidium guajava]
MARRRALAHTSEIPTSLTGPSRPWPMEYGPIFTVRVGVVPGRGFSSSEIAKELRKIATSERSLTGGIESLVNPIVASLTDIAIKICTSFGLRRKMIQGHILIDLKQWFANLSLSIVLKVVAGKGHCSGVTTADEEEEQRWHHALLEFLQFLGVFTVADALPFLRWLDLGGHEKSMRRIAKELDTILSGWLEEHKGNNKSMSEKSGDRDFMDVMLSTIDGKEMGGYDADTVVKATCLAIISGGTDTVMITLTWAVSLLLNNLPILTKAREELDAQIGKKDT